MLKEVVGRGRFGVVHKALWKGSPVAVKKTSKGDSARSNLAEVDILRQVESYFSFI